MFIMPSSWLRVIARVHLVHAMNAEQRQMAADPWTKLTDLSHRSACRQLWNYIHHCRLLLPRSKPVGGVAAFSQCTTVASLYRHDSVTFIITQPENWYSFTIPQRVEGWVDLDGWLHTQMVYLSVSSHPSKY